MSEENVKKKETAKTERKTTANKKLYAVLYVILSRFFRLLFRVKVSGLENEPEKGPFLVCPNHLSLSDVFVVAACMKNQVRFFAKAELFKVPILAPIIRSLGAFPVKRGQGDVGAVKNAIALLKSGEVVGLFPQGTRKTGVDPRTTEPKHGVSMIAYRTGVPVLPVCIENKKFRVRPFHRTYVRFGKPIANEELHIENGTPEEYKAAAELVFGRITEMLEAPAPEEVGERK